MMSQTKSAKEKVRIIFDANALFVPLQFNIDIFEETKQLLDRNFEAVVLLSTCQELERIAKQGPLETRKKAAFALKLAKKCRILKTNKESETPTDDLIVQAASKHNWPVFTNDRQLRNRLRDINVPVIYVRQKSRLDMDGRL
jgi:rRNA-processing protein FCF1